MSKVDTKKGFYYNPAWKKRIQENWFTSLVRGQAGISINWPLVILFIISFFIARASLMGEIATFNFIYWALMMRVHPEKKILVTAAVLLGWLTLSGGLFPPWLLPASMLLWKTIDYLFEKLLKKRLALFFTLPLIIFALRFPLLWTVNFPVYETAVVVLEAAMGAFLPPLIQPLLREMKTRRRKNGLTPEGAVGGVLLLILVFLGMNEIILFEQIMPVNILVPLLVLMGAYLFGPVPGMLGGTIAGFSLSLSNPALFPFTGALGISGFLAGVLKPYRRFWIGAGYFAMLRFFSYFGLEGGYRLTNIWEDLIVAAFFLIIPLSFWKRMQEFSFLLPLNLADEIGQRSIAASRIKEFAEVFGELAATFKPLSHEETVVSKRDLSPMVDYFSRKVCRTCGHYQRCWKGDQANQYRRVLTMLSLVEEKGVFTEKMIPLKLKRYCPRQMEIVKTVGNMREIYKLNCYWQKKIRDGRIMVSEQLQGISFMMHDLWQELKIKGEYPPEGGNNKRVSFSLEVGIAQVAKEGQSVSGDSYAVLPMKGGRQALLLSDGMGSGKEARQASFSAVRLMERLLVAGFQQEIIINTINTLLRLRYPVERFATMDLALLDLIQGEIELYKLGAPPSLIKSGASVKVLGSGSLPMGILEEIAPEKKFCPISRDGATFVMITDGLWDDSGETGENWLVTALKEIKHGHPQLIADRLIEEACNRFPRGVKDDLTVLVGSLRPLGKNGKRGKN
ncbi:MAG: SpoIIE family protein phosphatase [Firmicutes bacterium]|nr:SpoIIE family protein phosphatase [Bacillota bacterium]